MGNIFEDLEKRYKKAFKDINKILGDSIQDNFDAGGIPKWPPRKYKYPHPILNKTGDMKNTTIASTKNEGKFSNDVYTLEIMSTNYGKYHQFGKGHPKRSFVTVSAKTRKLIKKAMVERLTNG